MALGRCNLCRNPLRFGSRTCDRCGAKKSRAKLIFGTLILAQLGAIVWWQYFHTRRPGLNFVVETSSTFLPPIAATARAGWVYYETRDDLVHDVTHHARVLSRGAASSGQPNDTMVSGVMELRASTVYGNTAIINLRQHALDEIGFTCTVHAEFDAADAMDVHSACSGEGEQTTVMIQDATALIQRMRSAHDMSLNIRLSPRVERTMLFEIGGLQI